MVRSVIKLLIAFITISFGIATAIPASYAAESQTLIGHYEGGKVTGGNGDDIIYADGAPFTKDSFPGLILWLNASDPSTLNFKTGQWNDKSGHGNNTTTMCSDTNFHIAPAHNGTRDAVSIEQTGNCWQLPNLDANHLTIYVVQTQSNGFSLFSVQDGGWQIGVDHPLKEDGFFLRKVNGANAKSSLKTSGGLVGVTYDGTSATFYSANQPGEKIKFNAEGFNSSGGNYTFGSPSSVISEILVFNSALSLYDPTGHNLDMVNSYGPDTFHWNGMALENVAIDHITDFSGTMGGQHDKIDISAFELNGPIQVTGLGRLSGIPNQLVWFQSNIHTIIQFDRDGDRRPDWEIVLEAFNAADVRAEDFILPANSHN